MFILLGNPERFHKLVVRPIHLVLLACNREGGGESMMHHGGCHDNCGCGQGQWPQQVSPIVCPTQYRVHDEFTEREVPVIHPIVNVTRHNVIDVPRHYFPETNENVMGTTSFAPDGCGFGQCPGSGWGGAGRSPWM